MVTELRALVVGINTYRDEHYKKKPLRFARNDAEEMASTLHRSSALHIEGNGLNLLTNENATQESVWSDLNRVFATGLNSDRNTIALFYFAGHGVIDPIEGDDILLGCHNVDYKNPNQGGVRLNDIYRLAQRTSAGCSIVIIDACFSGGIIDLKRVDHESPTQLARKATELIKADGDKTIAIFTACSDSQPAREDEENQHGVYTQELLCGLRDGEARDEKGIVDVAGLVAYLSRRFAEDYEWQGPRSSMVGGRPVVLAYGEPRAAGTLQPPPIHPIAQKALTRVGGRNIIPTPALPTAKPERTSPMQDRLKPLALPGGIIAGGLLLLVLLIISFPPIQQIFLVITFIAALGLPFLGIAINRLFGIVLIIIQLILLAGFGYSYFGWGVKVLYIEGPLHFLASLLWLFWVMLALEAIGFAATVVSALMRPVD